MKKLLFGLVLLLSIRSSAQVQFGGIANIAARGQTTYSVAGVITINTDLVTLDCSQITQVSVHVTSVGTTGTITVQWSNYSDFSALSIGRIIDANTTSVGNTIAAPGLFMLNIPARYMRLRMTTATTAGTTAFQISTGQQTNVVSIQNGVTTSPAASITLIGDVGVQYRPTATGAASRHHLVSAATTNATIVKAGAGRLIGWTVSNTNAAWRYVKIHNTATTPAAGTGIIQTVGIPPNQTISFKLEGGMSFTTGIGVTTVTGAADADATAVGANDLIIDIFFL